MPCLRIGSGTLHCPVPLRIVLSPRIVLVPLLSCVVVFVVGGEVRWGNCVPLSSLVCVCCHSIVGLALCLCGRVVLLWNRGDGLCEVEGRVVSTVRCQLFMCCGVCFSVVCVVLSCCAVLWVVEWRWWGVWSCCLSSSSLLLCCWCSG